MSEDESNQRPQPGVSRENRVTDEGLKRLQKQLSAGVKISQPVLAQWVRRYGDDAKKIIKQSGLSVPESE